MFCYNCGASQPDNTAFCSNCGRPAQGPAQSRAVAQPGAAPSTGAPSAAAAAPAASAQPSAPVSASAWLNVPPGAQRPQQPIYAAEAKTDGKATGSLILGILSLLCFSFLAGIPAIVLGHISRKNIRQSMGRLKGDGMALAGLIMGYISIAFIPLVLIIAAIAIPNLLRSRIAANDAAAASVMRTINTAQVTYRVTYPNRGYARDLSVLGPGASGTCGTPSEDAACLIDRTVANGTRNGFQFSMSAVCGTDNICTDYVAVARPVTVGSTGSRTYCSTGDAVIHVQQGLADLPDTVEECQGWPPVS